jgi:hypothetical protein
VKEATGVSLKHLFDAELQYRAEMAPVVGTGEGELVGSGDGTVRGEKLEGAIRWTLFEQPGELVCGMNPTLLMSTSDGAEIRIDARGFARRESRHERRWQVAAALLFHASDDRYAWLDGALGVWEGEFDAETHRARYRAYARDDAAAKELPTRPGDVSFTRADHWRERRSRLEPTERALYREILRTFGNGERPTRDRLTPLARGLDLDLASALDRLEELDLVRADPDTGEVVVAYPFSGRPTPHRLELAGGREAYAMCAVDALGVAPMLGSPIVVRSRDPISREEIVVDVSPDGDGRWSPERAVVFVGGREGAQSISDLCCPVVNFFASQETASRYIAAHPDLSGAIVTVPEALARGRTIFKEALK